MCCEGKKKKHIGPNLIGSKDDRSPDSAGATTIKCGSALVLNGVDEDKCRKHGGWWVERQNSLEVWLI